jgi:hypothetical protein
MTRQEQILAVEELTEAVKRLSGFRYRAEWQEEIDKGEQLLQHLKAEAPPATAKEVKKPLHWLWKRVGHKDGVTYNDAAKAYNIRQCAQYIGEYVKYLQENKD